MSAGKKQLLRNQLRRTLALMSSEGRDRASSSIRDLIAGIPEFCAAKIIYGFYPMASEPDWLQVVRPAGSTLYLPRFNGRSYCFARVRSFERFEAGPMGILQPPEDEPPMPPDIALIPGLGFDREGHRLGRGNGIYDRLLDGLSGFRVGVSFAAQIMPRIPSEPHDQPVNALVNQNGFVLCDGDTPSHPPSKIPQAHGL